MNIYQQCITRARVREETHFERQRRQVEAWFESHPECRRQLVPLSWRGEIVRGEKIIDVSRRHGHGWWERCTDDSWIGLPEQRGNWNPYRWQLPEESDDVEFQQELDLQFDADYTIKTKEFA